MVILNCELCGQPTMSQKEGCVKVICRNCMPKSEPKEEEHLAEVIPIFRDKPNKNGDLFPAPDHESWNKFRKGVVHTNKPTHIGEEIRKLLEGPFKDRDDTDA